MQLTLEEILVDTPPRERSGSRSANRFEFQNNWALCKLIELHRSGEDYTVIFEHHDDILVLSSTSNPPGIDFYQIKTRGTDWTKRALIHREKGMSGRLSSPLGLLVEHKVRFGATVRSLRFVSNKAFKLKLKDATSSTPAEFSLEALEPKELTEIISALRAEHEDPSLDCASCTHLCQTPFRVEGHRQHAMGELTDFLADLYGNQAVAGKAAYLALCDEIRRRAHNETRPVCPETLSKRHGLTRQDFGELLADLAPRRSLRESLTPYLGLLNAEGLSFAELDGLMSSCATYEVERMDHANKTLQRARRFAARAAQSIRADDAVPPRLMDFLTEIETRCRAELSRVQEIRTRHYARLILLEAVIEARVLQNPDPKP